MSFHLIRVRARRGASGRVAPLTIGINHTGNKTSNRAVVAFSFSDQLLSKLRWVSGDRIQAQWGAGQDFGFLKLVRVQADQEGFTLSGRGPRIDGKPRSNALRIQMTVVLTQTDGFRKRTAADHEILADGSLLVQIPDGFSFTVKTDD